MAWTRHLAAASLAFGLCLASPCAHASDPWPGEAIQPPPDLNIILDYNAFAAAGAYGQANSVVDRQHTRISVYVQALRYIHTFDVEGVLAGVQLYVPHASFLGNQQLGISDIPAPAGLPADTPSYGAGHASLNHADGFGQPSFSAFFFPYYDPRTSTGLVLSAWVSPPIGNYNSEASLNYNQKSLDGRAGGRIPHHPGGTARWPQSGALGLGRIVFLRQQWRRGSCLAGRLCEFHPTHLPDLS